MLILWQGLSDRVFALTAFIFLTLIPRVAVKNWAEFFALLILCEKKEQGSFRGQAPLIPHRYCG
jgi:hypothetical protein